ncbi:ArsR/SmtB family transcription factor [Streptomyces avicenniae]|uniref:ArsR/SmtB family transcription factor n=1 Tax=Streptomyces avicenniae TaxID=500153 RepID=UPI00069C3567|nr:helix-turn-helix transcriptional regulator [Streptomyces avicenniae]
MTPPTGAGPATGRDLAHPVGDAIRLDQVLHALADPVRLAIVAELAAGPGEPLPCSALPVPVAKSTATHHFRVLRESGVLRQFYRGTAKMNELRAAELASLFPGLLDAVVGGAALERGRDRERAATV